MKKILFILLIILLASCEKEPPIVDEPEYSTYIVIHQKMTGLCGYKFIYSAEMFKPSRSLLLFTNNEYPKDTIITYLQENEMLKYPYTAALCN